MSRPLLLFYDYFLSSELLFLLLSNYLIFSIAVILCIFFVHNKSCHD